MKVRELESIEEGEEELVLNTPPRNKGKEDPFMVRTLQLNQLKRQEYDSEVDSEYCKKYWDWLEVSPKAMRSSRLPKGQHKSEEFACQCSLCSRYLQKYEWDYPRLPDEITDEEREARSELLTNYFKNKIDVDFVFIINRLRNYRQQDMEISIGVTDTCVFMDGLPQLLVRAEKKAGGKYPTLRLYSNEDVKLSKPTITRFFESNKVKTENEADRNKNINSFRVLISRYEGSSYLTKTRTVLLLA